MDDSAVSPVIAVMLILAVLVTFVSVVHVVVVPSMKAQDEIEHLEAVEEAFLRFSSDLELAASLKQDLRLSERVRLGGGSIVINPARSSGTLRVGQEPAWLMNVTLSNATASTTVTSMLVTCSYTPSGNYWQDQGYRWRYGYVNISKAGLETPLEFATMAEVAEHVNGSGFGATLFDLDARVHSFPVYNETGAVTGSTTNCTAVEIEVVNFTAGERHFASGNGFGTLALDCTVSEVETVEEPDVITIRVNRDLPVPLTAMLLEKCNATASALAGRCGNLGNLTVTAGPDCDEVSVEIDRTATPVEVGVRVAGVTVMAY
ncbi:hypothetical protein E2N92_12425 [Methanofollis formosanus]|uniref:Uncharacterized protein n=1 Tax=Methanofollis formosanus TaxID=299308 RepID=A0A8G1EHM9_9EURY|nr:hypothetical protein [Methanofollis formosanus]QYZ80177.1 hypothetical protein E2N92_12425 [Methanofollis formosanus]